ncbi:decarboxylating NADP(+)-dependent phosphogluconate dehydrogenase [Methylophaga pinxianii]|uniref:decarboxylating NADP(+)-dependent phosphogluconate dehydrogenase n=1 Tax=Methylophaga pinxianii TaxID=2881052 RepID=UPI001CF37A11|nr:decarboxylating NADP(+)-dependent phosphogluconate dehydrogenase [Methylophaga pinxianii]MCB2427453.1 decarboxylating NADP(+)-dependent phosphogluconate dehydrogenase [Methylophaga pinxianii]UPH44735.1 decarboxylating NADP(+)-dependent phosphogluconate dehydrogenase [Methylophaga pinxianii]
MKKADQLADIGVVGLAVMGQNLALNMNDKGYKVAVYNRTASKVDEFMRGPAQNSEIIACYELKNFIETLQKPRRVMLMVKAGEVVDNFIQQLAPYLEQGDIIIDGGNSLFNDSDRRTQQLAKQGILFVGSGVSGGEEGARHGPSLMPGGNKAAWPAIQDIFQSISAHVDGEPCCDWVGNGGAGHYVKMVHNGIEYGDMQLICEAYQMMREGMGLSGNEIQQVFAEWNEGVLDSYLIEITRDILSVKEADGTLLIDHILDTAGQKGTGKWTGMNALDLGTPLTLIGEAVFARCLSALKDERVTASQVLPAEAATFTGDKREMIDAIRDALYASKIISYAQGYMLMREAATTYGWELNYGGIAMMWRGGCIIRSQFLSNIHDAFERNPNLQNLLLDSFFIDAITEALPGWRKAVGKAIEIGVPVPTFSSALSFYDGYRSKRLPANLLQAQRDYFGAHTYERLDKPRGKFFHTNWTGRGGDVSASHYAV